MRQTVERLMEKYGTDMTIVSDTETKTARGFFRAVNSKSWQSMESEATLLGEISRGQYAYIGPVGIGVSEGDTMVLGGREYLFRRVEPYYYGNEAVYLWGLCVEKGVNDTWGSQSRTGAAAASAGKFYGGCGLSWPEISPDHAKRGSGAY